MSVQAIAIPPADVDVFGEGPHWDSSTQSLVYVDAVHNNAVYRWDSFTGINHTLRLKSASVPTLVIPCENGGYVVTTGNQICHLDWDSNTLTPLGDLSGQESEENNKFNDGKCDSRGRLWAGTLPTCVEKIGIAIPRDKGSLFSFDKRGIHKHADKISCPNGIAWSSDDRTLFFVDSIARQIFAFDFDLANGTISNRRLAVSYPEGSEETLGYPDGMTIDTNEKLWIACVRARKIACFDPETDQMIRTIELPVKGVTSCCFGGKYMDEMFVTSGRRESSYREDMNGRASLPGSLFKITGLGVKGHSANVYRG